MVDTLLELCVRSLGQQLCWGRHHPNLEAIPEVELAVAVWRAWRLHLGAADSAATPHEPPPPHSVPAPCSLLPCLERQRQVLEAFAAAFWRPHLLRLAYPAALPPGLASLPLLAQQLLHLELAAPALQRLDAVAAACPQLRCLSLRGCTGLGDASMAALAELTALQALDLGGLAGLSVGAAFHVAKLPALAALNMSCTAVDDAGIELLVYGHRVRAWQRAQGVSVLPPEAAAWPPLPLEHLQLAGTRVGGAGAAELAHLPHLRFLDMRHTGIQRPALGPLQRRFALESVQAAVLSSSSTVAAAVVNGDAVLCRCGLGAGATGMTATDAWEAEGVQLLLHFDPAAGLAAVLGTAHGSHQGSAGGSLHQASMPAGGRRVGYRQPRPLRPGGPAGGWHVASEGRKWFVA